MGLGHGHHVQLVQPKLELDGQQKCGVAAFLFGIDAADGFAGRVGRRWQLADWLVKYLGRRAQFARVCVYLVDQHIGGNADLGGVSLLVLGRTRGGYRVESSRHDLHVRASGIFGFE